MTAAIADIYSNQIKPLPPDERRKLALMIDEGLPNQSELESADWPRHNRRRWELIQKRFRDGLTSAEQAEWEDLQSLASEILKRRSTHPTESIEALIQELETKTDGKV